MAYVSDDADVLEKAQRSELSSYLFKLLCAPACVTATANGSGWHREEAEKEGTRTEELEPNFRGHPGLDFAG